MHNILIEEIETKMENSLKEFKKTINKIRTGRALPSLLDSIFIDYFGTPTPLKNISNITVENTRTLKISIFDNSIINNIKNAILNSTLNVMPIIKGNTIKIIFPLLTEDRRHDLLKLVRSESEKSRVSMRNIRRYANDKLKNFSKNKVINNDLEYNMNSQIQNMTNKYINKINILLLEKEREIMKF